LDDLKRFRQWDSLTPGHPEYGHTPGVETTTGPLGQGFATGIGMAMAQKYMAAVFNKPEFPVFDHLVYAIISDGDLMEGVSHEAASLAGHLGLDNIIYLYDDNEISIEGSTDITFTEDVPARFAAYGWYVQDINGHSRSQVEAAIKAAQAETERPSLIVCHTHIGYGSPNKQDTAASHGAPLGEEEVKLTKEALEWDYAEPFTVPEEALTVFRHAVDQGKQLQAEWAKMFEGYKETYPEESALLERLWSGELPEGWTDALPSFAPSDGVLATRKASGAVLNAIAPKLPTLVGGSADLAPSTNTYLKEYADFQKDTPAGRNLRFGVREHAMGSILNGLALYGGLLPYGGTFFVFSDYMRPPVRLAALMKQRVVYVWTHDSVWIGEDGPTHQPIEHLAAARAIPNLTVIRPADANETVAAWRVALERRDGPTALALTRQKLPILFETKRNYADTVARGAYVLADSSGVSSLILIATGSEVSIALDARDILAEKGIAVRVVSMPSWELFEAQPAEYRDLVLPPEVPARLAIEAGISMGWDKYVGPRGAVICLDHFGSSAPYKTLMKEWGFTPEAVAERALKLLK
jgi:transketolase